MKAEDRGAIPEDEPSQEQPRSGLIEQAISRPITVVSMILLVLFFGILAVTKLPIQLTPDIAVPTVTVGTKWPGASPIEIEAEILNEQEEVLKRIQGLELMTSTAKLGEGDITLEFSVGTDIDQALVRVANQLSQVPSYPDAADQPVVQTSNANGPPLAVILVRHQQGKTIAPYRTWVEEEMVPELERVEGIASTWMRGGQSSEIHVTFDTRELAARAVTVVDIASKIRQALRNSSAGDVTIGKRRLLVRTRVAPDTARDLEQLVVQVGPGGTPVLLRDVAQVKLGLRKRVDFAIGDQREAIALLPRREAGSNVLEVTEKLRQKVNELDERHFAPEGLVIEVVSDQTDYIYGALHLVRQNLLIGAALAMVVLLLFLRSFSAAAVVAVAIPVCVLGTALGMTLLGRSVNVVSLAGITFAVGMVVDNSIVALENIDTWRDRVASGRQAAANAIQEVWGALLASTATTAAVFIPIVLWEGEVGELLRDVAYAISISVILSFFVAVLAIPSLAARLLRPRRKRRGSDAEVNPKTRPQPAIVSAVAWVIKSPLRSLALVGSGVLLTAVLAFLLLPKMEYLPTGNRNLIFGIVLPPPGIGVEELLETGFVNQAIMAKHTGKRVGDVPAVERSFFVGDPFQLFVGGVAANPNEVLQLRDFMAKLHARIPGGINFASQAALFSRGIGEGRAVEVRLSGNDLNSLIGLGKSMFGLLTEAVPESRVRPIPVLDEGAPEWHILPQREQLALVGFQSEDLALIADAYIDGAIIGEYGSEGQRKIDVLLRGTDEWKHGGMVDESGLSSAPVAAPNGKIVPFGELGRIETRLGPTAIRHIERKRSISLQLTPPDDVPFEEAIDRVTSLSEKMSREGKIPAGIELTFGGSAGKLVEAQAQFAWILFVALIISFFLLAGLFEDFLAPVVVLVVLPLAAAGGVLALALVNRFVTPQPLDLMTALGFLILIGVVVNNAILIVDGALARLRRGWSLFEATLDGVRARVRPILMSTLTSLAGLMPMVVTQGAGGELYRGVGTIVLGGLALSTGLSLFVVPALFTLIWRLRPSVSA